MIRKDTINAPDGNVYSTETQMSVRGDILSRTGINVFGIVHYYVNGELVDFWQYNSETGQFKVIPLSGQNHE